MFYSYFADLCKQRGISLNKACTEMGLSRSVAAKWKSTNTQPSMETLRKIADYFQVSFNELLTYSSGAEKENPATESDGEQKVSNYDEMGEYLLNIFNQLDAHGKIAAINQAQTLLNLQSTQDDQ